VSDVTVRFLGSGDAFGSGGRLQACILLRCSAGAFLLDCGSSSLIAMKHFGVDPADIRAILVTHLHGDHFGGIPFFLLDAQFSRRVQPLAVAGPPGVEARIKDAMEVLFPGSSQTERRFETTFVELEPGKTTDLGGVSFEPFEVDHASGAPPYALRVACDEKVIAYSGDTEWTESLIEASRDADLFVCEAYFFDKRVKYHLDYSTLAQHRTELGCRRLVLTHMSADMLEHLSDIDAVCAEDGMELTV